MRGQRNNLPSLAEAAAVATILVVSVLIVGICAVVGQSWKDARIMEDDPRWDCATMGNGVCGRD